MKTRYTSIELLRIVAMFLIVQSHFVFHGYRQICGGDFSDISNPLNEVLCRVMFTGNIGNVIFMIITGFFLCDSEKVSLKKLLRVVIQVFFYSVFCYFGYQYIYTNGNFSIKEAFIAVTPLIHSTYWYFTSYVLIYIFHPYLNLVIKNTNQKKLCTFIAIMMVVWGFIPALLRINVAGSDFLTFVLFYYIGGFLRRYYIVNKGFIVSSNSVDVDLPYNSKQNRAIFLVCLLIWILIAVPAFFFGPIAMGRLNRFTNIGSPLTIALSVSLFLLFLNITSIVSSKAINKVASCVGGVYLLHDNPYVRSILYTDILHLDRFVDSNSMFLYTITLIIVVFVLCLAIEFIRKAIYDYLEGAVVSEV